MNRSTTLFFCALLTTTLGCAEPAEAPDMSSSKDMSPTPDMPAPAPPTPDMTPDVTPEPADPGATCDTNPRHPRCDAAPGAFDTWDAASVVSDITFIADETCCFDLDGDGVKNNALGELLMLAENFDVDIESFNTNIKTSIEDGSVVLLVEHQNLTPEGGPFSINYYLGDPADDFTTPSPAGSNPYTVHPDSLTQGVWPSARMAQATLTGSSLVAGPGTVNITTALLGPPITLNITAAQISATLDEAATNLTDGTGVRLIDGKLGGAVRISEIFDAVNDVYAQTCTCAPIPDSKPFITYDVASLKDAECAAPDNDTSACDPESVCVSVYGMCSLLGIASIAADIDADNVEGDCKPSNTCDALSLGTTFETVGARLTGVKAP